MLGGIVQLLLLWERESVSHLVMSDDPMDPSPPGFSVYEIWDSLGKNTGVDRHSLLQGIFLTQGSNPGLPHCRWILYQLSYMQINGHGKDHSALQKMTLTHENTL